MGVLTKLQKLIEFAKFEVKRLAVIRKQEIKSHFDMLIKITIKLHNMYSFLSNTNDYTYLYS